MKRAFILFLVGFLAIATVGYLVYLLVDALHAMYKDWRLGKEMDELQAWSRQKKQTSETDSQAPPKA